MRCSRLKLNADKTQIIWIGTRQQLAKVGITSVRILSADVGIASTVNDLGVNLDSNLTDVRRKHIFSRRHIIPLYHHAAKMFLKLRGRNVLIKVK
jgi:hypothetical protein